VPESPAEYRAVLWTYALTGLRAGEVPALQWGDIDFDAGLIHVRRKLLRGTIQRLKTDASHAPVGLPPILADILIAQKAVSRWAGPEDFVFSMPDGRPYSNERLTKIALRQARERAGFPYEKSKTGFGLFHRSFVPDEANRAGSSSDSTPTRLSDDNRRRLPVPG
jgi:integrase